MDNSFSLALHFGNVLHLKVLPMYKAQALGKSYHEPKHTWITRHRKGMGKGSYANSLRMGGILHLFIRMNLFNQI
jgi:hypothetical protein